MDDHYISMHINIPLKLSKTLVIEFSHPSEVSILSTHSLGNGENIVKIE
jgi:hypothetical protein